MVRAWLDAGFVKDIHIIDPVEPVALMNSEAKIAHSKSFGGQKIETDILVLAVKPQVLKVASGGVMGALSPKTPVLSIAAGQSLDVLGGCFGKAQPIIRSMPNTPAAIGRGVSVSVANSHASPAQKEICGRLLGACGHHYWVEDEGLIDSVTALSGSGPAYVFYMIEALTRAGEQIGLDAALAAALARQTVIGSAALAEAQADISPAVLRQNVTSPGGTTQAGLEVLMDGRFDDILLETLKAAKARSEALKG